MNNVAMLRKIYFCGSWVFWFVFGLIFRTGNVLERVMHSAWVAFMFPGWFAYLLLGSLRHVSADDFATAPLSFVVAALFWFFPVARLRRHFGTFDAVGGEGKGRRPLLVRGAAYALDAINKRLFGRQKTGGWA